MVRTLILGFLLLAAARSAAADEAAAPSTPVLAARTSVAIQSVDATKQRAKKPPASAKSAAARACRTASRIMPCCSYQVLARRCSSGTRWG